MVSDLAAYALLASIFIVNGLRMFIEKPTPVSDHPARRLESFRKNKNPKPMSFDS